MRLQPGERERIADRGAALCLWDVERRAQTRRFSAALASHRPTATGHVTSQAADVLRLCPDVMPGEPANWPATSQAGRASPRPRGRGPMVHAPGPFGPLAPLPRNEKIAVSAPASVSCARPAAGSRRQGRGHPCTCHAHLADCGPSHPADIRGLAAWHNVDRGRGPPPHPGDRPATPWQPTMDNPDGHRPTARRDHNSRRNSGSRGVRRWTGAKHCC